MGGADFVGEADAEPVEEAIDVVGCDVSEPAAGELCQVALVIDAGVLPNGDLREVLGARTVKRY